MVYIQDTEVARGALSAGKRAAHSLMLGAGREGATRLNEAWHDFVLVWIEVADEFLNMAEGGYDLNAGRIPGYTRINPEAFIEARECSDQGFMSYENRVKMDRLGAYVYGFAVR